MRWEARDWAPVSRRVAGVEHVGLGGDYMGVPTLPVGLEDVSGYPEIFAGDMTRHDITLTWHNTILTALIEDTEFEWTDEDLGKLANQNLIRTLRSVEVRFKIAAK